MGDLKTPLPPYQTPTFKEFLRWDGVKEWKGLMGKETSDLSLKRELF